MCAALLCVPTLGNLENEVEHSMVKHRKLQVSGISPDALKSSNPVAAATIDDKATAPFRQGEWKGVWNPSMAGLSAQCHKAAKAEAETKTGMNAQSGTKCYHTPCTGRVEGSMSQSTEQHVLVEGPMCLPEDCRNSADLQVITSDMQNAIQLAFDDSATVALEIDCDTVSGAAGYGKKTDIDYTGAAKPIPATPERASERSSSMTNAAAMPPPQHSGAVPFAWGATMTVVLLGIINLIFC